MKKRLVLLLLLTVPFAHAAQPDPYDSMAFSRVLKEFVQIDGASSSVNYAGLKLRRKSLDDWLTKQSSVTPGAYQLWDQPTKMAFLINAYNGFTLKLIIDHYPVQSIKDLGSLFSSVFKKKFFTLLGEKRSVDWIEHQKLRKDFQDPRIHFAINCASIGCPALSNQAYEPKKLDSQLEAAAQRFLRDASRNRYDEAKDQLFLSKIFDWFEEDFKKSPGGLYSFVARYLTEDPRLQKEIIQKKPDIEHTFYDWKLNETKKSRASTSIPST